jgi:pimeloyl-ACP methyl ester carboxylesterase
VRPLVLVHGIGGSPHDWAPIVSALAGGRTTFSDAYADDLAALGSVSRSSVWAIGYYKRRATDQPWFNGNGSIGGCPVPRTDPEGAYYTIAYVDLVDECVEAILRATGAPEVDMVGCSMGGIVSRAYLRWRSGHGPNGASRVRRFLLLESPSRGLDDIEAIMLSLSSLRMPFQRWGEIAELSRDYPAWGGESYIERLNDGWDAWASSHGVVYGNVYGFGHPVVNPGTLGQAIQTAQQYLGSGGPGTSGASTSTGTGTTPAAPPSQPTLGIAPTPFLVSVQESLIFLTPSFDLGQCLHEILGDDSDGFVRVPSGSARAGPEFSSVLFDSRFRGLHLDRGQHEETIQWCTNTAEAIRRFLVQGRVPTTTFVQADLEVVAAPGVAPWLHLDYEVAAGEGFSVQVFTEDATSYWLRQICPLVPDSPRVYAAPLCEGQHSLRLDGDPPGDRVATVYFYDASGAVAEVGPISIVVPQPQGAVEAAPVTSFAGSTLTGTQATVNVTANGRGAEFSWRLVSEKDATQWSAWSSSGVIPLGPLPAGTYELSVLCRDADDAAGELVESSDPLRLGLRVDGNGTITVRR